MSKFTCKSNRGLQLGRLKTTTMRKTLKASSANLHRKIALFLLTIIACSVALIFLFDTEWHFIIIAVVLAFFVLRNSYRGLVEAQKLKSKQFQMLVFEDTHFLFQDLPLNGGRGRSVAVQYENIKSVGVDGNSLFVLLVRRQNWVGLGQDYFAPVGVAPKLQLFALPARADQRATLFHYLRTQGFRIERKINR
jgi:hypothetical protein